MINNIFITSEICMCDLIANELMNIILIMILIIENKRWVATVAYPVVLEPFLLVDVAFVGVVIPLDAVQTGYNANHQLEPSP